MTDERPNKALDQSRDLVWENGSVGSSQPGQRGSFGDESQRVPVISMFYGITVSLYFLDNRRHHQPHIHARFQGNENGGRLGGNSPRRLDGGLGACSERSAAVQN